MCGIAGFLSQSGNHQSDKYVQLMQTSLQHRGPDDRGVYLSEDRTVALAHTRLSILDLSPNGHQPMSAANQRYWITFNGEIYNFLELRERLKGEGETFVSHTDTEVILKLYAKYKENCVKHLRGMFAFAIWDDHEKVCFIARDPLGIKPLYYCLRDSCLIFASELRAILSTGIISKQLSPIGLYSYFTNGSISEPWTIIDGIRSLEAGSYLLWKEGRIQHKSYWQIDFSASANFASNNQSININQSIDKVRQALIDSVQHHFISDVPVGIFLSGGIDSTALVAIARQTQTNELRTYSVAFDEEAWNEGNIARQVAREFGTVHTEYVLTADIAKNLLPDYWRSLDQPTIDGFNTFCVAKIAHEDNMKVVLSGLGGDEIFGGYGTFQSVPQIFRRRQRLAFVNAIASLLGRGLESFSNSPKYRRLGAFLSKENSITNAYALARGVFSDHESYQLVKSYLGDNIGNQLRHEINLSLDSEKIVDQYQRFPTNEDQVSYLELSRYMRNQLLRDSDVMSMKWGLELRVPFVDSTLLSEISQIPAGIRLQKNKSLLTKAIPEIPDYIANRQKRGFTLPFEKWINKELREYTMDIKVPIYIPLPPKQWYRRWSLVVLQNWWQSI
ncbi:asparagine synthase (glutamine-hydrolyzing) [Pseudanabaena biceps]|nr:asparagine synthase (glutamine-hydrolyzing) [Pseudanabaena biceps]